METIPRRIFNLLPEDEEYLLRCSYRWETIVDGAMRWLLIYDYTIPFGYIQQTSTVAFLLASYYSGACLDMFYFSPTLTLKTGRTINATNCTQAIEGILYQRWSRHRKWRPYSDNLETHISAMDMCLQKEVG